MDDKRLTDWENLFNLTHEVQSICGTCPSANKCRIRNRPPDCPIWASLEDAGDSDLRAKIFEFINNWEPRESGHHGVLWYACQELRGFIGEPGCNCDECNYPEKDPENEDG